jgi:hypothetical protein
MNDGTCWGGGTPHPAEGYLVAPDGERVPGFDCRKHAEAAIKEYADRFGEHWTFVESKK